MVLPELRGRRFDFEHLEVPVNGSEIAPVSPPSGRARGPSKRAFASIGGGVVFPWCLSRQGSPLRLLPEAVGFHSNPLLSSFPHPR